MATIDKIGRLDQILHNKRVKDDRSPEQCDLLSEAAMAMENYQRHLQIPERDIKIIRYLANNPRAALVREPNVMGAFKYAKEAMRYAG